MVAGASNADEDNGNQPRAGLSQLDAALLRSVAEIASQKGHSPELQTLAKAMIGVIQAQAEMAQLLSQFMQLVSEESRKRGDA